MMKPTAFRPLALTVVVLAWVALVLAAGVALAATITGTDRDETLIGTKVADTIRAKGGDDEVRGLGRPDTLYGNAGRDMVVGGYGEDELFGGDGNDRLVSEDIFSQSGAYRDFVDCGPGQDDFARIDFRDREERCERVVESIP